MNNALDAHCMTSAGPTWRALIPHHRTDLLMTMEYLTQLNSLYTMLQSLPDCSSSQRSLVHIGIGPISKAGNCFGQILFLTASGSVSLSLMGVLVGHFLGVATSQYQNLVC